MPEVVELYVVMHCEACATSVKRAVKKIPGVESYKIDYYGQKVTVIGNVDREDVWRRIHKTGKRVTLIPKPAPPKEEPKEEKKEETKEEKTEEKQETKVEEKTEITVEEKTEETKDETKVEDTKEATVVVRKKSMYWPGVRLWRFLIPRDAKVHEKKEEVVTVVEKKEETKEEVKSEEKKDDEAKPEAKEEAVKSEEKKEPEKPKEPEWVPMFVSAPYYTLPSRFY